ncbi:conserved protein of unknown function [Georgfuchsia toluolica]|uniref:Uncharacterized protein n=1 Tax=Georgfuchsia toluolica TaxID=424218 RepID=A0A916NH01_9PROT|nr:hypothetical protein [Georgfuchsia toluolica]CAG4882789.1 conserved protein of unknown function [Georgfuchsia toluolica]
MANPTGSIQIIEVEELVSKKTGKPYKVAKCIQTRPDGHINVGKIFIREGQPATQGVYMPTYQDVERDGWITPVIVELRPVPAVAASKAA